MKILKKPVLRVFALLLCVCLVLPAGVVFAKDDLTVAFVGNTSHRNKMLKLYPALTGEYLASRMTDYDIKIVNADPIDLTSENFLEVIRGQVLPKNPEMVFLELDISKRYLLTQDEISAKLESIVKLIQDNCDNPAIYFIYMPEENLFDGRDPFDKVAKYYGISVCDVFSVYKDKFEKKIWEQFDFLNIGKIPGERGHAYISEILINHLLGIDDLLASPKQNEKTLYNIDKYLSETPSKEIETPVVPKSDGAVIYVAKSGSPSATGTINSPFGTLEQARNHIRRLKKSMGDKFKGATVYIREGLYETGNGFKLTKEDSGTAEHPIVYSAYPGETVRLTNGTVLDSSKFSPVTDPNVLKKIPESARGKVLQYDLMKQSNLVAGYYISSIDRINPINFASSSRNYKLGNQLVVNGKNEQRASWPDAGYSIVAAHQAGSGRIAYDGVTGENWVTAKNAYIWGTLGYGYYTEHNKVKSIDLENRFINLTYNSPRVYAGNIYSVQNLLEELSIPSEWYADPDTDILYYYPRSDIADSEVIFVSNPYSVVVMEETEYITLSNLKIEVGGKDGVEINDGYGNLVDNCEIAHMGFNGVSINNTKNAPGPGKNGVTNSHIHDTMSNGVYVLGGDSRTLTSGGDYVKNCHFENYSTHMHSESGGVLSDGAVDLRVSNCNFHTDDSCALFMGGYDDMFEYNEIYSVSYDTDDYGAIYGDSRGAIREGVTIHHTYFHDINFDFPKDGLTGLVAGIYTDCRRNWGANIHSNVFYNVWRPLFLADNRNQRIFGNLIMDTGGASAISATESIHGADVYEVQEKVAPTLKDGTFWTETVDTYAQRAYGSWKSITNFEKESMYAYYTRYPWLEYYEDDEILLAKYMQLSSNAVFNSAKSDFSMGTQAVPSSVKEDNYLTKDKVTAEMAGSDRVVDIVAKGIEIAAENISDFPVWDVNEAGLLGAPREIGDFELISPYNGQTNVDVDSLVLRWDFASGADTYHVEVSSDPEFNNVDFETKTPKNWAKVKNLKYGTKKYYWRVTASSTSEKFVGSPVNVGGVQTFWSMKSQKADKIALGEAVNNGNVLLGNLVEGTDGGQYPEGTKAEFKEALDYVTQVYEGSRSTKNQVDSAVLDLEKATKKALSKANLEVIDLYESFSNPEDWQHVANAKDVVDPHITQKGDSLTFSGTNGVFHSNQKVNTYNVVKFKAKFNFNNPVGKNYYSMVGLRVRNLAPRIYNNFSYAFLVNKNTIELQGGKYPANIGKFVLSVDNTFIEEGKEHEIEFAALPAKDGIGVRLILLVDGKLVYDHTDINNFVEDAGMAAINSSNAVCEFTLSKSSESGSKIIEMLNDPQSELNQN